MQAKADRGMKRLRVAAGKNRYRRKKRMFCTGSYVSMTVEDILFFDEAPDAAKHGGRICAVGGIVR